METRKVQITGGSTFIISLPKTWVKEVGVKANDTLGFIPQHDGTILLTPRIVKGSEVRKKALATTADRSKYELLRSLIGAYMMGYDLIEVRCKPRMTHEVREMVRKFTQMTIGPEIVDEGLDSVVTKDLLDPTDLPFDSSIRRMHRIVDSMHRNAAMALKDKDAHLAQDVISRDAEVDRLNWLVARQFNMIVRDIKLAQKMETTRERAVNFLLIARIIERIGDHAVKIADNVARLQDAKLSKKKLADIQKLSDRSLQLLSSAMDALFKKKMSIANDTIASVVHFIEELDKFETTAMKETGVVAFSLGQIIESIRRTGQYAWDISECVINFLVDIGE